ncbi:hypothetical protein DIPPA_35181 [Diplonema papillatum]|nr:hypothetical protein DIPPA_35181 [Diplonema papillatum]
MQALVALAYAAVGWNGRWALGGEGLSCKEVCSSLGDVFSCTEAVWPTVQPDFFTDASLDITENTPLYCDRVIPGGFTDAPVVLGNGSICVWSAPQNTGNNGQYRPGDGRCTRIASLRARRVCPCGSSLSEDDDTVEIEVGGVAGWGHKAVSWIGKDQPFTLRAGVKNVLVTSTVVADEYFYTRTDGVTRRLQAQHSTVAAGPPAPETDSFRAEVMILVSNDLVTVAVLSDATLRAWSSGTVEHLPYRSHSTVEEELYYYSGSPWYTDGWLTPPSFGADIPEAIRAMVLAKGASFVRTVVATRSAFAMLCANGWLVAWGDRRSGGALPDAHAVTVEFEAVASSNEPDLATPTSAPRTFQLLVLEDVDHVSATRSAFCVVFANGTLTSWGSRTHGGTPPHTPLSIAPLARTIPDQPPDVGQRYIRALSTEAAFAALTVDFTVDAWGLQETGGSPLPEITFGTTKVFPDATIVQQCGPGTRVVDTEKECMSLAGRLAKATFEVVANDSHPGGCTYQEWPERLVVKWNPCVYCPACPGTTFPHLIAEFPRLTQSASVPVASAVVCHNLCCAADECRAAVFWNSAFCMFMTEQVLSPADPATRNVSVDTFVKGVGFELNSRPLCMDNSSTSDSGVLKRSEVVGLFASPFSFLAVDSTGNAALWPHRASIEQSPGLQRAFNNASGRFVNAFGSVSGFVLAFVDPGVVAFHTLFSSGNTERYWEDDVAAPRVVTADVGGVTNGWKDIKLTDGAAAVLWGNGSVHAWKTAMDSLAKFRVRDGVGCVWTKANLYQYLVVNYSHTREECADSCLKMPGCTGFEYPTDGKYCAPWLWGSCVGSESQDWKDTLGLSYLLYTRTDLVFDLKAEDVIPRAYYLLANSPCTRPWDQLEKPEWLGRDWPRPDWLSELTTDDARAFASNGSANEADPLLQKCKAFCSSVFACTAVQYVPSEAACFFFGDASAVEPSPPLDDDDEEENSTNMTTTTPNKEVDPNDYGSDSFCFAQRDLKKKSLYRYSHLTLTSGPWSVTREFDDAAAETDGVVEIKRTRMRPSEFAITTGSDDPIFDPIQWLIQAVMPPNEAGHRASITILQKTTSGKVYPSTRGNTVTFSVSLCPTCDMPESYRFVPLRPRNAHFIVYSSTTCDTIQSTPPTAATLQECAYRCHTLKYPGLCSAFLFNATISNSSSAPTCTLFLDRACTSTVNGIRRSKSEEAVYVSSQYVSVPANSTMEYGQNVSVAASKAPGTVLATNGTALLTSVDVMATTVHTLLASKRSFTGVGTYQAQVLPPGESVSAEVAVRSSQFQPTSLTTLNSVFSWGSVIVGGASRQLPVIGEAAYLNVGTFKVLAGGESFVAVRYAPSGHSECALNPCQQSRKVEAVFRHSDQAETLDERQVCIEWNDSAASPSSFACYCTGRPGSAMGGGATCPKEPYLPVWPFLLILLPLCGANFWTCYLSWLRNRVRDQEVACLSDMYSLNASDQEECALQAMLAANDGYEVALLQTLVPHFGARSLETRCFLLWQRRLARIGAADTDLRVLPRDLLRPIQHFVLGLETLQKTRTQPITPLGYLFAPRLIRRNRSFVRKLPPFTEAPLLQQALA